MGKNAYQLFAFWMFFWASFIPNALATIVVLKFDRPIVERPDISVTTFIHENKFKGFYTVVVQSLGKKKLPLYKTVNQNKPFMHHEYAVYWAMCEFSYDSSDSSEDEECPKVEAFDNNSRFDLFPVLEEDEEKE